MYTIDPHGHHGLYTTTTPPGSTVLGTITRSAGDTGALVHLRTGTYVQVNAGAVRTLDQRAVRQALGAGAPEASTGAALATWREQAQLSVEAVAQMFGVRRSSVYRWEHGSMAMEGPTQRLLTLLTHPVYGQLTLKALQEVSAEKK